MLLLVTFSLSLTIDDIAIAVQSNVHYIEQLILPMSQTWYQLVPEVHIYTDSLNDTMLRPFGANPRSNVIFHVFSRFGRVHMGSRFSGGWDLAQSRHLHAIADLYDRQPHKSFYMICDDDTFVLPSNLVHSLSTLDADGVAVYGLVYGARDFVSIFFRQPSPRFNHGGAGIVIPRGMMKLVGPTLRNCSDSFEVAAIGSDMRLAWCISRLLVNGRYLNNWDVHRNLRGINPFRPGNDFHSMLGGQQLSFHNVPANLSIELFRSLVTVIDPDSYFDWQSVAFQPLKIKTSCWAAS
jgi:hypothetical protein